MKATKAAARALQRDHILATATSAVRLRLVLATRTLQTAIDKHEVTNPKAAVLLGRTLVATALMASLLRGEERTIVQLHGGPEDDITQVYGESMALGELRGFVTGKGATATTWWPGVLPPASGSLTVQRVLYGRTTAQESTVQLTTGDVEGDLNHWFAQAEQVPTYLRLDVEVDGAGLVVHAGGALVQRLSAQGGHATGEEGVAASDDAFEAVATRLRRRLPLGTLALPGYDTGDEDDGREVNTQALHALGLSLTRIAKLLLPALANAPAPALELGLAEDAPGAPSPFARTPLDFFCRCSKHRFMGGMGPALLSRLRDDYARDLPPGTSAAPAGVVTTLKCHFCASSFPLTWADVVNKGGHDATHTRAEGVLN
jgi:redox-regulated HSP33 family molecular chaperone